MKSYKTIWVDGKQMRLHRYLMEQHIGRKLTFNEVVHHIDEDIYNNELANLEIVPRSKHILLHPKIISKATASKTKYFIETELLKEMFCEKRMTLREISSKTNIPPVTIFYIIKRNGIKREKNA